MIDLYKQTKRQQSNIHTYIPAHMASILAFIIFIFSNNFISTISQQNEFITESLLSAIPGDGLDNPIRIRDDLHLDTSIPPKNKPFWLDLPTEEIIQILLETMNNEELLSQLFVFGWESEHAEGLIMDWISKRNIGGVKVFGRNGKNLEYLSNALTEMQATALNTAHGIPLFTATDQEGGWIHHIKGGTSVTPGNMAIGASAIPIDSYLSGYYIGLELRAIGVNMNFAPTVDVYVNSKAHVIGPRAFSDDPQNTAMLGLAFFHGQRQTGVISTAKHFPGHGNAYGDSHVYLPVVHDDLQTLWERDLLPYRVMIPEGLPVILSGHLNFPRITGTKRPASLSSYFKHTILREKLGFEGIVITDDLYMGGTTQYGRSQGWRMAEIVLEALKAGSDMVMLSRTPTLNDIIWKTVYKEYEHNGTFRMQVQESLARIMRIKLLYLKEEWRVPFTVDPRELYNNIRSDRGQLFFQEQAARGVTLIRARDIPFQNSTDNRLLLVSQSSEFFQEGLKYYPHADRFYFDYEPFYQADDKVISDLLSLVSNYDKILFNLANPNSLNVLKSLEEHQDKIIVFSVLTPIYLNELPWVQSAIAVYGWGLESFSAGFAALNGDIPFMGKLPFTINATQ